MKGGEAAARGSGEAPLWVGAGEVAAAWVEELARGEVGGSEVRVKAWQPRLDGETEEAVELSADRPGEWRVLRCSARTRALCCPGKTGKTAIASMPLEAKQAGRSLGGKNQSRVDKQRGGQRASAVLRAKPAAERAAMFQKGWATRRSKAAAAKVAAQVAEGRAMDAALAALQKRALPKLASLMYELAVLRAAA